MDGDNSSAKHVPSVVFYQDISLLFKTLGELDIVLVLSSLYLLKCCKVAPGPLF